MKRTVPSVFALALTLVLVGLLLPAHTSAKIYSPPWVDLICGNGYTGTGDTDLTSACKYASDGLVGSGYHTFIDTNISGFTALSLSYAQSDAIWMVAGHGLVGGGGINTMPGKSVLASGSMTDCASSNNACIYPSYTTSKTLSRVRLMLFVGCHTAEGTGISGNLLDAAVAAGADAALGFRGEIFNTNGRRDQWLKAFFINTKKGMTIYDAAKKATTDTTRVYGDGGMGNFVIKGNSGEKLSPAAYGVA
jgi:hypothetical protein